MAEELWDLSEPQERMAVAMWREEMRRGGTPKLMAGRTLETFRDQSEDTQARWLGYAAAALETLLSPYQQDWNRPSAQNQS